MRLGSRLARALGLACVRQGQGADGDRGGGVPAQLAMGGVHGGSDVDELRGRYHRSSSILLLCGGGRRRVRVNSDNFHANEVADKTNSRAHVHGIAHKSSTRSTYFASLVSAGDNSQSNHTHASTGTNSQAHSHAGDNPQTHSPACCRQQFAHEIVALELPLGIFGNTSLRRLHQVSPLPRWSDPWRHTRLSRWHSVRRGLSVLQLGQSRDLPGRRTRVLL
mmetsp:Transcript_21025/g.43838  ORF Transcript_21025/g.43838 Transcript_21025/m.43838 type:complete len:221 (-) Transcript_21025:636-1298(-)